MIGATLLTFSTLDNGCVFLPTSVIRCSTLVGCLSTFTLTAAQGTMLLEDRKHARRNFLKFVQVCAMPLSSSSYHQLAIAASTRRWARSKREESSNPLSYV